MNGQAEFVLTMLNNKTKGFFLELGSGNYMVGNKTYVLEKTYDWSGVMIDYDCTFLPQYKMYRPDNLHLTGNTEYVDYIPIFRYSNVPYIIDYLHLDVFVEDSSSLNTIMKFDKILFDEYKFATITFCHDIYASKSDDDIWALTRQKSREILLNRGYVLAYPDVEAYYGPYEDWYIHPELVDPALINTYTPKKPV